MILKKTQVQVKKKVTPTTPREIKRLLSRNKIDASRANGED
jgi:hypothetical protein